MAQAPDENVLQECLDAFRAERHRIFLFGESVRNYFGSHPTLAVGAFPHIHSVKYRVKEEGHLREKIIRKKVQENRNITAANLFEEITDLAGVRVLHLHTGQFSFIHSAILEQLRGGHWFEAEPPKAYTWDPDAQEFYGNAGIATEVKPSHYTSVHYLVRPNEALPTTCEIQVRTLFEEVWGEIDHTINYENPNESVACREQLRVLAKMVAAGTRLCESIFKSDSEYRATHAEDGGPAAPQEDQPA